VAVPFTIINTGVISGVITQTLPEGIRGIIIKCTEKNVGLGVKDGGNSIKLIYDVTYTIMNPNLSGKTMYFEYTGASFPTVEIICLKASGT
jgi:hypothetical protein